MAVVALAAGLAAGWPMPGLALAILAADAVAILLIDARYRLIPNWLSLPLIPLGLVASAFSGADRTAIAARLITMAGLWFGLLLLRAVFTRWRQRSALGMGDVKLMIAAAAWLAPAALPDYLLCAALSGLAEGIVRSRRAEKRIAFGSHLAPWLVIFALLPVSGAGEWILRGL